MTTAQEIKNIIATALDIEETIMTDDATMGDFPQWDSMGHMEVVIALDIAFGVGITPESIQATMSIPNILNYIESK